MSADRLSPDEMRRAADLLEEWSERMDYSHPEHAEWSAHTLRHEANILETEE